MKYVYEGARVIIQTDDGNQHLISDGAVVELTDKEFKDLSAALPGCYKPYVFIKQAEEKKAEKKSEKKTEKGKGGK